MAYLVLGLFFALFFLSRHPNYFEVAGGLLALISVGTLILHRLRAYYGVTERRLIVAGGSDQSYELRDIESMGITKSRKGTRGSIKFTIRQIRRPTFFRSGLRLVNLSFEAIDDVQAVYDLIEAQRSRA